MFSELAKSWRLISAAALFPFVIGFVALQTLPSLSLPFGSPGEPGVAAHAATIGNMRETIARERAQLAALEVEQSRRRIEVLHRRKLYADGQLTKDQVHEAEQALIAALRSMHKMRESVLEMDIAMTEAVLGEKVERMPVLQRSAYRETRELARYKGNSRWSLAEAPRIDRYFSQTFGRRLPVTAMGQTATHDRLRFDHREAIDVALHPDSTEGKALIEHLTKSGIPFLAFRGASPGLSTGAHIHIGKPSARLRH